ncbi:BamA/OMP85 family outer membrane protein [Taibaiella koreensis]|uniref:BamA/OMP85 family outer membrane protein n=1 Tax=Taibaiella koreensis TaxID=1268548 RepID=UPI000E59AF6F|nr:POTRA domain-containing protein [Taibaiella koreensis]
MHILKFRYFLCVLVLLQCSASVAIAQMGGVRSSQNADLVIGDIKVSGAKYMDVELLKTVSGLAPGDRIKLTDDPAIAKAIRNLWNQQLFSDVSVNITKIVENKASIEIVVAERPRLSRFTFKGISKSQESEIKEKLNLVQNRMVTEAIKKDIEDKVKKYYADKGFVSVTVNIREQRDTSAINSVALLIDVNKGGKTHINQIMFTGNEHLSDTKLKGNMKGTKEMPRISLTPADESSVYNAGDKRTFKNYLRNQGYLSLSKTLDALNPYFRWNIFAGSKFNPKKYDEDKNSILAYYNSQGYRDAQIVSDTTYKAANGNLNVELKVKEGRKYYFGDIAWRGNTKYSDSILTVLLGIKKGDVFDQEKLDSRMGGMPSMDGSQDIGSLYMDDGYLFFKVDPVEKSIVGDTINYEVHIQEGPQATIKNIGIYGNDRTNDHVLRRELFTRPGYKFSRTDIIRSIRQISNLGFIDPEKVNPVPKPNYADGTVDIDYNVVEKSSDQLELSAGFGGGIGFTGTIGIVFNNFSLRNILKFKEWDPLPMGDGQKLSVRYQSNGKFFNSANLSFTEPWLGGKRPTALTVSAVYGRQSYSDDGGYYTGDPNAHYLRNFGGGVSLSKRLKWPDDNFVFSYGINYQNYFLKDYDYFVSDFRNGTANNLFFRLTLARNSVDQPIYPRSGSNINFTFQFTPPYSLFSSTNYADASPSTKYKWIEYHKYRFTAEWYQRIVGDLVFKFAAKYGFMGYYNKDIGYSPFERFNVGGDGLSGFNYYVGRDIISQRGYEVYAQNAVIFNKYTAEVRYPFSLNPSATIFGLAFVEGANGWDSFKDYNPFKLYRSAGLGVRVYLPMFGLLGLDYGLGFDRLGDGVKFGGATKFTFMLGFEPD